METLARLEEKLDRLLERNLGRKARDNLSRSRDNLSPLVWAWSEPWQVGELVVKAAQSLKGFERRYVLRPMGPTKFLLEFIDHVMSNPENQNFHVQSKRCYIHVGNHLWEPIKAKRFYQEIREKILYHYRLIVLRSQLDHVKRYAKDRLEHALIPWTNQHLEVVLGKYGSSSWADRKKRGEK